MSIFDQIEKLITEHGSATILRERIALLKDQFAILEKENINLRSELATSASKIEVLETENQNLKLENEKKDKEIEILKKRIDKIKNIRNKSNPGWGAFT